MQRDGVLLARHVLAADPDRRHVVVLFQRRGHVASPAARLHEGRRIGQPERQSLQVVAAVEAALRIERDLVGHHRADIEAAVHVDRLAMDRHRGRGRVVHVVAADLPRRVGQPVREQAGRRVQQQPRRFDRIARHADHARLLQVLAPLAVGVQHAIDLAGLVVLDLQHHALGTQLDAAGRQCLRNLGIERRPFGADLAALHAEAGLLAGRAAVVGRGIGRHRPHDLAIADLARAGRDHLVLVALGHRRLAAGGAAGHAHLLLGLVVVRGQFLVGDRPVQHVGAFDLSVDLARAEVVRLEAQRDAGPVDGRAANRLDDPRRQVRIGLGVMPAAGRDPLVEPRDLAEHRPFVVLEVGLRIVLAGLENHDLADAPLRQLVGQRGAARARADDDDRVAVVQVDPCCHVCLQCPALYGSRCCLRSPARGVRLRSSRCR